MTNYTSRTPVGSSFAVVALTALVLSVTLVAAVQTSALAKDPIRVIVNGASITGGPVPYVIQGETFMAVGPLISALGGKVQWEGKTARVESMGHKFILAPDTSTWILDGESTGLPRMTFVHHNFLYVPLETVVESLGCHYRYDAPDGIAYISTPPF